MDVPSTDCREDYEVAIENLAEDPENLRYRHQAVLALARAGSLEFAQSEFHRYGLDSIEDDEDILGLKARLLKDRFLQAKGSERTQLAKQSAAIYLKAFETTGGYYTGINAATMSLLANEAPEIVQSLARSVVSSLPDSAELSQSDLYFVEATRAEALLLRSEETNALHALEKAWRHDPMNYTAHASTLRQIHLVCEKLGIDSNWLDSFTPPKCMHFAGHAYASTEGTEAKYVLSVEEETRLRVEVSNTIQRNDIGFGYGALSAGSDILIAETLLNEGGELNVVLPVDVDEFRSVSVTPFGANWCDRFDTCLSAAKTITVVNYGRDWPNRALNQYCAKIAMGNAIIQANLLAAQKMQLLILTGGSIGSYSEDHLKDWSKSGYQTSILSLPGEHETYATETREMDDQDLAFLLLSKDGSEPRWFDSAIDAAVAAMQTQTARLNDGVAIVHGGLKSDQTNIEQSAREIAASSLPGGTFVSGEVGSLLTLEAESSFSLFYTGRSQLHDQPFTPIFGLGGTSAA